MQVIAAFSVMFVDQSYCEFLNYTTPLPLLYDNV